MSMARREFLVAATALAVARPRTLSGRDPTTNGGQSEMYGLIGKMTAVAGERDALIEILLEGTGGMPGCLSYVIATDAEDENAIWITEVWESEESHQASLSLPAVQDAIARGRPLIAGFDERTVTTPVGGHGLADPS